MVLTKARESAEVSHNHPEGIKGAQATAACVFWALQGESQASIKALVEGKFGYDLNFSLDKIRDGYEFDVSCQGSVPQAIVAFLESTDYEDAIRNAISIGGDSDTIAAIAGGIAEAFYREIPSYIKDRVVSSLPSEFREVIAAFYACCGWEDMLP
jgi:ADP-ribosylglycohydrolase